jgi:iron(III) transport system permease protein
MLTARGVAFAAAAAILGVVSIAPLVFLLVAPAWAGRWDAYGSAILDARQIRLLVNSVGIAGSVAVLATAIGAPLGFLLARAPIRARGAVRLGLAVPVVIPTYALALSWIYMAGGAGFATRLLASDAIPRVTYSPAGVVIVLALALYPVSMLATEAAARRIESRLEEAALLVAPLARVLSRVTIPLLWPTIASSALLTFVLALSDYSVPNLLRQRVFTTEVFTAFAALYDASRATALALPLLGVALVIGYLVASIGTDVLDTSLASSVMALRLSRLGWISAASIAFVLCISVALPLGTLAAEAGSFTAIRQGLDRSATAIGDSVILASIAATLMVVVALVLGYRRARSKRPGARWTDAALIALFAVPGTIVGVALIELWNRPGWSGVVYGTSAMVVIAYLARFIPVATLVVSAGVRRVPRSTEDAAALSGAGWARTMRHIVVPQLASSLGVAWVLAFVLAFGEVGASVLVAPAGHAPFPVHVFTLIANAPTDQAAALALVQVAVVVCPFLLATAYASWPKRP